MQLVKIFQNASNAQRREVLGSLAVLSMQLLREIGNRPELTLWISHTQQHLMTAFIGQELEVELGSFRFSGIVQSLDQALDGYGLAVVLQGGTPVSDSWQALYQKITKTNYDVLFYPSETCKSPDRLMKDLNLTWYWPLEGIARVVSLLEGENHMEITEAQHDANRFQVTSIATPLTQVDMSLSAKWIEQRWGETDVSDKIKRLWPDGVLRTLDPDSLEQCWFKPKRLNGGYRVVTSQLLPSLEHQQSVSIGDQRTQMYAFKAQLVLGWRIQQRRAEQATFQLQVPLEKQQLTSLGISENRLSLSVGLQDITATHHLTGWMPKMRYQLNTVVLYQGQCYRCRQSHVSSLLFQEDMPYWQVLDTPEEALDQRSQTTYFSTERGRRSLEYGLQYALARLQRSWMARQVSFYCPLELGLRLTENMLVTLTDGRAPGGKFVGKIQKLTHRWDPQTKTYETQAVALCLPGGWASEQLSREDEGRWLLWPFGKPALDISSWTAPEPPQPLSVDRLIRQVVTAHMGPEQLQKMLPQLQRVPRKLWPWVLRQCPTDVTLDLADLSRREEIHHTHRLKVIWR